MEIRSKCAEFENQLEWNPYPKLGEEKRDPTNKAEIVNRWTGRVEGDMKKNLPKKTYQRTYQKKKELPKGKKSTGKWFSRPDNSFKVRAIVVLTGTVAVRDGITSTRNDTSMHE